MNKDLELELKSLFNSVKIDKSKDASVERTTLISLFQYHQLDTLMPEFYRYICQSLEKLPKITVTEDEFLKILMNPQIDLSTANKEEMADAFSILDVKKTGSIDIKDFLEMYRDSQNYRMLSEPQKKEAEEEIRQAFFSASEDGKITPMDFYHIVKFK